MKKNKRSGANSAELGDWAPVRRTEGPSVPTPAHPEKLLEELSAKERERASRANWAQTEDESSPNHPKPPTKRMTAVEVLTELLDWVKYILIALLIGLLLTTFVIQRNEIMGDSMSPALHNGDQVIVQKLSVRWDGLQYGDIVTMHGSMVPGGYGMAEDLVKRIVGRPGDLIEIKDGGVHRNGERLEESYLAEGVSTQPINPDYSAVRLGEDEYYVLGDNRDNSRDSREFGPVPHGSVIGELLIRFFPFDSFGLVR
ncbi:MAG: signal peptidase I [Fastidiosipilaceae bacterium]